ncbi:IS1182 family transposase [Saccharibacillus sp. CPCC 101409]|uniref:IS1182 family transposase n=1 Tax=Saccharibacillus sp. CPCC 101409 TaxID=3058041 RepID=UPI002671306A|nr:IS1182 family transposase [Saccharibacillus sp. CPCC 101409]MDO3410438.1 IS1182 family transposase [Saccharibacillus sp. CPCC 101409]
MALYDLVVPPTHMLRQLHDLVDFSFVREELESRYCLDNGRLAIDPIRLFKYLLLKALFPASDWDLVERSRSDLAYKYFLDMAPEEQVMDSSSLTVFRKRRLQDEKLLDLLIGKTVQLAQEKNLLKSRTIIVDATHTKAHYNQKKPEELLHNQAKKLRKTLYGFDPSLREKMPKKPEKSTLETELSYCETLIETVSAWEGWTEIPAVGESLRLLQEMVEDDQEQLRFSADPDAKVGHKSADSAFFGYKTHLAMSEERLITAAVVTTGEKNDGKQLQELIQKSRAAGMEVETVVGDMAYSEKDNLIAASQEPEFQLISRLNPLVTQGNRAKEDEFEFNKDAGMYVCKAGHLAIRKARQGKKKRGKNQRDTYYFEVEKCSVCPFKEGCYKEGAKSKTYSVTIKSGEHEAQMAFQETEEFREKAKERYKIEAKNSELKNRHGYEVSSYSGLTGMQIQGAMAIFAVNVKRILKLMEEQKKETK